MNRNFTKSLILLVCLFNFVLSNNCTLPKGCFIQRIKYDSNEFTNERNLIYSKFDAVKCIVKDANYKFEFDNLIPFRSCLINENNEKNEEIVIIEWSTKSSLILDKHFDLPKLLYYLEIFKRYSNLYFAKLKGFAIDLNGINSDIITNNPSTPKLYCTGCTMNFYTNQSKLIKSCADIINSNSSILSFFQIKLVKRKYLILDYCKYPNKICPLVFKNIDVDWMALTGLVDSFYKKNTLTFTNEVFGDLNQSINKLQLSKVENIKIDSNLLNPSVFNNLWRLEIYGPVKSVDKSVLNMFKNWFDIKFLSIYFRKMIHENGIDWIKELNNYIEPINLTNFTEFNDKAHEYRDSFKIISIFDGKPNWIIPLSNIFPEEDFCVYKDFPFDRLVILMQHYDLFNLENIQTDKFTCTYLWLSQYLPYYYQTINTVTIHLNIEKIIEAEEYKNIESCTFEKRLELCNKTDFKIKDIWSSIDYTLLNKKLQTAIKLSSYLISFLGLITNMLTIVVIVKKDNSDLFKGFKQYSYLCINSVFCIMILVINILSWMTECFYPFEVFCPEIRKVVFIQFFKIIFKECLTTTFRFMLNFSYVAFALNRIGVISKDKNKLVKFMCDLGIKKYIVFSLFISAGLSAMKFFKYEINYEYPFMNYPISNEWDIFEVFTNLMSYIFDDAFFIVNTISDIINYVLFVLICLIIDIYMVVQLRSLLAEKMQKMEVLFTDSNKSKLETTQQENEDAEKKAIQMVVINTAIGLLFKMPVSIIPIINVYAQFYFKNPENLSSRPAFGQFYSSLFHNGFYSQISDIADLLFVISISIQFFIYTRFDKKIQTGFDRLKSNGTKSSQSLQLK